MKTLITLITLLLVILSVNAQEVEWTKNIYNDYGLSFQKIFLLNGGEIVCYSSVGEYYDRLVTVLNENGEVNWEEDVCECDDDLVCTIKITNATLPFSYPEIEVGDFMFIYNWGLILLTDSIGQNSMYYIELMNETDGINIIDYKIENNSLTMYAHQSLDGEQNDIRVVMDLNEFQVVEQTVYPYEFFSSHLLNDSSLINYDTYPAQFIRRIDKDQNLIWNIEFDENEFEIADVHVSENEFIYVIGEREEDINNYYLGSLIKMDIEGNILWEKLWEPQTDTSEIVFWSDGFSSINKSLKKVRSMNDGSLLIAGVDGFYEDYFYKEDDPFLIKIDPAGNVIWEEYFTDGLCSFGKEIGDLIVLNDEIILAGTSCITDFIPDNRVFVLKIKDNSYNDYEPPIANHNKVNNTISIYPNPTQEYLQIDGDLLVGDYQVSIIDLQGRIVKEAQNTSKINIKKLAEGIYYLQLTQDDRTITKQWVKIK